MATITGRRRVLLNSASATTMNFVQIAAAFIMSPLIVGALGDRVYGVWEVLISVVGYFGILDAGLGPAIVRYIAVADRDGDRHEMSRIISTTIVILGIVGAIALVLMLLISRAPEAILKIEAHETRTVTIALMIIGLHLAIRFPGSVLDAYCLGRQRHYFLYSLLTLSTIVSSVGIWYGLTRTAYSGLLIVATFRLVSDAAYRAAVLAYVLRDPNRPRLHISFVSLAKIKELYLFGLKSMLLMVSDRLRRSSMPIVITHAIGLEQVVFYTLAERLVGYATQFVQVLGFPLTPYFSSLSGEKDEAQMRREWLDMSRFLQFVQYGFGAGVIVLGVDFLGTWMGEKYAVNGAWVIYLVGASFLFSGIAVNAPRLLVSLAKHERAVKVVMPTNIVAILVAIVLAKVMGLPGIALAIFLAGVVASILLMIESCRSVKVPVAFYLRDTVVPNLLPVAVLFAALYGTRHLFVSHGYLEILACGAIAATAYLVLGWYGVLRAPERERIGEAVLNRLGRRRGD